MVAAVHATTPQDRVVLAAAVTVEQTEQTAATDKPTRVAVAAEPAAPLRTVTRQVEMAVLEQ